MVTYGGNSRLFLALALAFGLLAAGLTWFGLRGAGSSAQEATPVPTRSVVFAKQNIPPRTVITETMVEVRSQPLAGANPSAATAVEQVVGRGTRQTILTNDQVTFTKLFTERAEAGLSFIIPEGRRAEAIATSQLIGSGGLILPGDRVDVIAICQASLANATQPAPGGGTVSFSQHLKASYVLQNIEVLAVDQLLSGTPPPPPSTVQQATGGGQQQPQAVPTAVPQVQPNAQTVTLAVTPEEALRLALHDRLCEFTLTVRRFDDTQLPSVPPAQLNYGLVQ
ncbi:MAG TPA: Flp pilus assembly protein CpaB [Dehalococcoidia bacterium]|nr:Flp pilus assembly protein CpaB [Dehalococcoidia bacterium]